MITNTTPSVTAGEFFSAIDSPISLRSGRARPAVEQRHAVEQHRRRRTRPSGSTSCRPRWTSGPACASRPACTPGSTAARARRRSMMRSRADAMTVMPRIEHTHQRVVLRLPVVALGDVVGGQQDDDVARDQEQRLEQQRRASRPRRRRRTSTATSSSEVASVRSGMSAASRPRPASEPMIGRARSSSTTSTTIISEIAATSTISGASACQSIDRRDDMARAITGSASTQAQGRRWAPSRSRRT